GAGVIFGATGGVMEAALRTAAYLLTGENPAPDAFADVRTGPGLREATYEVAGIPVRCAVVSGLGNARALMEQLKAGRVHYDFVEVMACPGGCVGGGGQPISCEDKELYGERGQRLYALDKN
ncbi:[Fe-Fe] hydrogenase large subunit C-terminal domain-containing protein, partial [Anaerostipes hadrus]|uniref:[Fe-Fe] hydrogenase large subunit C-terminal domain-containing protein n=1 Tax=Anaerostipes hadrus TaxID=649756 RepID=UPI0023EA5AF0